MNAASAAYAGTATNALNFTGIVTDAQLSTNIVRLDGVNQFSGTNTFDAVVIATNPANQIAGTFTGNGVGLTNVNATTALSAERATVAGLATNALFAGTATNALNYAGAVLDSQLSANIARLDGTNLFTATNRFTGVVIATNQANQIAGTFTGNGAGVTNVSAVSALIANSASTVPASGIGAGTASISISGNAATATVAGTATNALNYAGAVTDSQLSTNVVRLGGTNLFTATNRFFGVVIATNLANQIAGSFSGNGAGVTNLNATQLASGTVPIARLTGITSNELEASTWGAATNLNGGFAALATNLVSGIRVTNLFITNSVFAGNGGGLTNLNAAQLTGALPLAQLPAGVVTNGAVGLNLSGTFSGSFGTFSNLNLGPSSNGVIANRIQFTDTLSNQLMLIHAEKNLVLEAENDASVWYGHDFTQTVDHDFTASYSHDVTETIGNTFSLTVGGSRTDSIGGNHISTVGGTYNLAAQNILLNPQTAGVGINVTTPASELDVNGELTLRGRVAPAAIAATNLINLGVGSVSNAFANGISFFEGASSPSMSLGYDGTRSGADNALRIYSSTGSNIFTFEHGGAMGLGVVNVSSANTIQHFSGAVLTVGGSWVNASDRNAKENFTAVNPAEVLARVVALPLTEWNYKAEGSTVKHIGPMAQDFREAFALGMNDKSIATVDADGVALAAIQGLNQKLQQKDSEISELKQQLAELKVLVQQLAEKQ